MTYLTPGEQYLEVLKIIKEAESPIDRLTISRAMGYSTAEAIHKSLKALKKDEFITEISFERPNGQIKHYYAATGTAFP